MTALLPRTDVPENETWDAASVYDSAQAWETERQAIAGESGRPTDQMGGHASVGGIVVAAFSPQINAGHGGADVIEFLVLIKSSYVYIAVPWVANARPIPMVQRQLVNGIHDDIVTPSNK